MPIDRSGNTDSVVRPPPLLAGERETPRYRAVDVGEILRLHVAVSPAGAGE
jgi:hypothetical protein